MSETKPYEKSNIWGNMDETGCFLKALPEKGFGRKGEKCSGGKKSKQRMTVAFFSNAEGETEKLVIIWKYENPRCFSRVEKSSLPLKYFIRASLSKNFDVVLSSLNRRLVSEKRSILLVLDNAGCHPKEGKYSNIKLLFFLPNTTSLWIWVSFKISKSITNGYSSSTFLHELKKVNLRQTLSSL